MRDGGGDAVEILELLDLLDEELAAGRKIPIGGGVVVDRKRFSDLINELRLAIPANVRQARGIIERGEQAIAESQTEAARVVAAAEQDAAARVADSEVLRRAQEEVHRIELAARDAADRVTQDASDHAERMVAAAEAEAKQQRDEADAYAIQLLTRLQQQLGAFLGNVRDSLKSFPDAEP